MSYPSPSDYSTLSRNQRLDDATTNAPADVATAANVAALARSYDGISAGLAYALGASGYGPGDVAQRAWERELTTKVGRQPGTRKRAQRRAERRREREIRGTLSELVESETSFGEFTSDPSAPLKELASAAPGFLRPGTEAVLGSDDRGPVLGELPGVKQANEALKPVSRFGTVGLMAPLEAGVGWARQDFGLNPERADAAGPQSILHAAQQTTAYQVGRGLSAGEGFLPSLESPAAKAQAEAAREFSPYLIGGHAWTPGRAVADTVFEPDDDAFKLLSGIVDGGIALSRLDPSAATLGMIGQASRARRALIADELVDAGVIAGPRKFFSPTRAGAFMDRPETRRTFEAVAKERDHWTIAHALGIDPFLADGTPIVDRLAHVGTADEVADIFRPHLGVGIRETFTYKTPSYGTRMWSDMPGQKLSTKGGDAVALNDSARNADLALVNIGATLDERKAVFGKWASAASAGDRYAAADASFDTFAVILKRSGVPEDTVNSTTRMFRDEWRDGVHYLDDMIGNPLVNESLVQIGDQGQRLPHPVLENQLLNSDITLPNAREMRRMTSTLKPLVDSEMFKNSTAVADVVMDIWRKTVVARPATGLRIIGDEQLRIATTGYASMFRHPLSLIAYAIGSPDDRWVERFGSWAQRLEGKAAKKPWVLGGLTADDDLFTKGLYQRFQALGEEGNRIRLREFALVNADDPKFPQALAENVMQAHGSKIGQEVVSGKSRDELIRSFWEGDLKNSRLYLADDPRLEPLADDLVAAERHLDVATEGLRTIHSDNPTLIDAIRTGEINGVPIYGAKGRPTKEALDQFQALINEGVVLPRKLKLQKWVDTTDAYNQRAARAMNNTLGYLLNSFLSRPSNFFSRNPVLSQSYAAEYERLFPHLNRADRTKVLDELAGANLDNPLPNVLPTLRKASVDDRFRQMHVRLNALEDEGGALPATIGYDGATLLAKNHAIKETQNLLYDLSKRSRFMDAARIVFPFGEAFREVTTRWAKLTWQNPQVFRRGPQVVMGARGAESDAINHAFGGTPMGEGFFHKDQFGQEVFVYPGSEWLTGELLGVPVPLKGSVAGLNLIGSGMPGVGPAVQIPVSWFIPDKPEWDEVANMLSPFGQPEGDPFQQVTEAFLPGWAKKARSAFAGPESSRVYANTVMDVARYLSSTGDYHLQGPEARDEMARLLDDAKKGAKSSYLVRTIGQATLPTSPSPEWLVHDKKGKLTLAWRASKWYYDRAAKVGPQEAFEDYLDKFGTDNFLLVQPKSRSQVAGSDRLVSTAGSAWARANPDIAEKFPNIYGLFAPDSEEFDSAAYQRQFERGEREQITPKEALASANARLANIVYTRATDSLGEDATSTEGRAYLSDLKAELEQEFPGYNETPIDFSRTDRWVNELARAAKDPKLRKTDAGRALKTYLAQRDAVIEEQRASGLARNSVSEAQAAQPMRDWLREWGEYLVEEHPRFAPIWTLVFAREVAA